MESNQNIFVSFFCFLVDLIIIVIPASGYLDTVRIMIQSQSAAAFNYTQCLILISAQGLKILYRIFHPYATRIFGQSVSQFTVAFVMVYLRYHYLNRQPSLFQDKSNLSKKLSYYFYTTRTKTFSDFLISFTIYLSIILFVFYISYTFIDQNSSIEAISIFANLIETTIVLPIFVKVVIRRDISNLSKILVVQFASGDIMRLILFVMSNAPKSFIAGVCLQIVLDLVLFGNYLQLSFCSNRKKLLKEEENLITNNQFDDTIMIIEEEESQENL